LFRNFSSGPANLNCGWISGSTEYLHQAVLRPIAGTSSHQSGWSKPGTVTQADGGSKGVRIPGRTAQTHTKARQATDIAKQSDPAPILPNHQVHAAILIIIAKSTSSLLAVKLDAALLRRDGRQAAPSIPAQPQATPRIQPRRFRIHAKEVLAEKGILVSIAIDVADGDTESWRPLGL
jgi:hypothetical protein